MNVFANVLPHTMWKCLLFIGLFFVHACPSSAASPIGIWGRYEHSFVSNKPYDNPLYDIKKFAVKFTSPRGIVKNINGFWDGNFTWKVRFAPDEQGEWTWESACSDESNTGLHQVKGQFTCVKNSSPHLIYQRGSINHPRGTYHLSYANGTPFFWAGCTAWNGTLKSTEAEWDTYLADRARNNYSVIQFVTTQWRGGAHNSLGQVAFEGSGKIKINPDFFRHLDGKIDKINEHGLVAAPVLLWALATYTGRELSPGYYLPEEEAILLARYMVARYGGNHVIWILGGDGKYTDENEQRWKNIGRGVFTQEHPGLVALHPGGASWIGEVYAREPWVDIIGYQSGHNASEKTVNFINKGPISAVWHQLPPRPVINMEPLYEETNPSLTATDIRNASYWSILNLPTAGITYGAHGLWPWLRDGEKILNHRQTGEGISRWHQSIKLPGSVQVGYLSKFIQRLEWWNLKPASGLLAEQPGDKAFNRFISLSRTDDGQTIVAYVPKPNPVRLYNFNREVYEGQWFNPASNQTSHATITGKNGIMEIVPPAGAEDMVLVLHRKK